MENLESTKKRPDTTLDDFEAIRKEAIVRLQEAWNWEWEDYELQVKALGEKRDAALRDIHSKLQAMGVSQEELPIFPSQSGENKKSLTTDQIKQILFRKMRGMEKVKMHEILDFLGISYARVRAFIQNNPDFIQKHSEKRGTYYTLVETP
jgi:hypothetical protein